LSHFTVMVVVNEAEDAEAAVYAAEAALEPFNENAEVEPYFKPVDDLDACLNFYRRQYGADAAILDPEPVDFALDEHQAWVSRAIEAWTDRKGVVRDGVWGYESTYNPKSKWDWYSVGGRWTGYFLTKEPVAGRLGRPGVFGNAADPGTADVVRKGEIDFEGMRRNALEKASQEYDEFDKLVAALPDDASEFITWQEALDRSRSDSGEMHIEAARALYGTQSLVEAMRKDFQTFGFDGPEGFFYQDGGRDRYLKSAADGAVSTFAVLDSEGWHERGSMGWFGAARDEVAADDWNAQVAQMLDNLDNSAWLVLTDCHI
jgi:hypothetical protein